MRKTVNVDLLGSPDSRNVAGPSASKQSKGKKSLVLQELIQETKEKTPMISAPRCKVKAGEKVFFFLATRCGEIQSI